MCRRCILISSVEAYLCVSVHTTWVRGDHFGGFVDCVGQGTEREGPNSRFSDKKNHQGDTCTLGISIVPEFMPTYSRCCSGFTTARARGIGAQSPYNSSSRYCGGSPQPPRVLTYHQMCYPDLFRPTPPIPQRAAQQEIVNKGGQRNTPRLLVY